MSVTNTKRITLPPNVKTETGISQAGIYKWTFVGEEVNSLFFAWIPGAPSASIINDTWFKELIEITNVNGVMNIRYNSTNQTIVNIERVC